MYLAHFNLREAPFSIAPDPAYLYLSPRHQEALGHLLYGTGQHGGFVQLTGEVGTGKTTIVRTLLRQKLDDVEIAMVHNPRQSETEFVASICDEFNVQYAREPSPSLKTLIDALNAHLLETHAAGRRSVLIIDEAQNLAPEVLEQVRLLTNLETDKQKLLRIMLVGQPELVELLGRNELRQLASRITARFHLLPLSEHETREYIIHRLNIAGGLPTLFSTAAIRAIHQRSRGIPRLINILCDRALLGAYASNMHQVTPAIVRQAAGEVLGTPLPVSLHDRLRRLLPRVPLVWIEGVLACAALIVAGLLLGRAFQSSPSNTAFSTASRAPTQAASVTRNAATVPHALANVSALAPTVVANPTPDTSDTPDKARLATTQSPATADSETLPASRQSSLVATNLGALLEHPESLGALTGRLIALWKPNIHIGDNSNVCTALGAYNLQCYHANGTWADLEKMNRPAILRLTVGQATSQYVLLRRLDNKQATLDTANGLVQLPVAQLRTAWTGEFFLLWRGDTGTNFVHPYDRGAPVVWLRQQLARVNGTALPDPPSPVFDAKLRQQVRDYQRAAGLKVDGLAGAVTLISLSTVGHVQDTPMLHPNLGASG